MSIQQTLINFWKEKMAKFEFFYGVMNSSKTTNLLQTNFNYKQLGYKTLILKPCLDTRDGVQKGFGTIKSRLIDEKEPAYYLKSINGADVTAADVAEALGLEKRSVDGIFTSAIQRKGLGVRTPAEIQLEDGTHKQVKFLSLTPAGMAFDPDSSEEE